MYIEKTIVLPRDTPSINIANQIDSILKGDNIKLDSINKILNNKNISNESKLKAAKNTINELYKSNSSLKLLNSDLLDSLNRLRCINYKDSIQYIKSIQSSNKTTGVIKEKSLWEKLQDWIIGGLLLVVIISIIKYKLRNNG
jgi:hypothetical protein